MIGRTLGLPLAATIGFALLCGLAVPIVLATAEGHLGAGMRYLDVVALCGVYAAATIAVVLVPWQRLNIRWSFVGAAVPVVFVASLSAMTGAGSSPYAALYAPILAIAGWYLPLGQVVALVALVVTTEIWRATAIDGSRSLDQLAMTLPFAVAVAVAASASARLLRKSLTSTRLDQVQMAATLDAIRNLGVDRASNLLHELERSMENIFDARATAVTLSAGRPAGYALVTAVLVGNVATVPVPGATKLHALLTLEGHREFTSHELRLAAILAEAAGRTLDAREAMAQKS